jgi:hypothetical protein
MKKNRKIDFQGNLQSKNLFVRQLPRFLVFKHSQRLGFHIKKGRMLDFLTIWVPVLQYCSHLQVATQYDISYIPPENGQYRTREAKRKRTSKPDQEKYFLDFPSPGADPKKIQILGYKYLLLAHFTFLLLLINIVW